MPSRPQCLPYRKNQSGTGKQHRQPLHLTLNQVYCDGLYLRIGLTLTAPDGNDSLAGYDWLAQNPGGEGWIEICQAQADGTLLANGQALYPQNGFVFEKSGRPHLRRRYGL